MVRVLCLILGHRWQDSASDYDAEYSEYPILHCARCGKQKAFPPWKAVDPVWRLGRVGRLRLLARQAVRSVGWPVLIGLAIAGVVGLIALEVKAMVIALAVIGGLAILAATIADPMAYEGDSPLSFGRGITSGRGMRFPGVAGWKSASLFDGVSPDDLDDAGRQMRVDDVLYAAGVVLIGIGVLLHFVAT